MKTPYIVKPKDSLKALEVHRLTAEEAATLAEPMAAKGLELVKTTPEALNFIETFGSLKDAQIFTKPDQNGLL